MHEFIFYQRFTREAFIQNGKNYEFDAMLVLSGKTICDTTAISLVGKGIYSWKFERKPS